MGKIIGLDPAAPLFKLNSLDSRLSYTDAKFVEVLHTSIGMLGIAEPIGDTDFYLNGGTSQPGCEDNDICDHIHALMFYLESVNTRDFIGIKCESYELMAKGQCESNEFRRMGDEPGPDRFLFFVFIILFFYVCYNYFSIENFHIMRNCIMQILKQMRCQFTAATVHSIWKQISGRLLPKVNQEPFQSIVPYQ